MKLSRVLVGDDGSPTAAVVRSWAERFIEITGGDLAAVRTDPEVAGSAAAGLLAVAREQQSDLIAVGRRGGGGFPALRLGSTVHQVVEHSPVPVAVVPPVDPRRGLWPSPTRVAVGVDGSAASAAAASWAGSFAAAALAQVWVVHGVDIGSALGAAGLDDAAYRSAVRAVSEVVDREWCAPLRTAGVGYETVIEEGGAAGVLLDAADSNDIDLVVVGRRGAGGFSGLAMGSVAHRVIAFAPCPAVVVPDAA